VPVDLERIAMRLLERNVAARYATAEDVIDDLLACRDAPRGGRDELVKAMIERFPGVAPSRPVRRAVSAPSVAYQAGDTRAYAGAVPVVTGQPPISSPTATTARDAHGAIPTPVPAHLATPPGMSPGMSVETRTVTPGVPRTKLPVAVWLVGGGVLALLITLIALTISRSGGKDPGGGSGSDGTIATAPGSAGSGSSATPATVIDASLAPAAAPPDAAPAPPPAPADAATSRHGSRRDKPDARDRDRDRDKPDARVAATTTPERPPDRPKDGCTFDRSAAKGTIKITGGPWAFVYIDGVKQAQTAPSSFSAPAGCHKLRLENDEFGKDETRTVDVVAGKTATVRFNYE
jgi:serine/threonine-protein kinase